MSEPINTVGPVRTNYVYLAWKIHKGLGMVAGANEMTREALVEYILQRWLDENYPAVGAYLEQRDKQEKDFLKSICPAETLLNQMAQDAKRPKLHELEIVP